MKVKEIMTKDPACCTEMSTLTEISQLMADNDCGLIPVVESKENAKPIGTVTDRDIALRAFRTDADPRKLTAKDVMSKDVISVSVDADVEECCDVMKKNQIRRVLVIDGNNACCGIVAQGDVALNAAAKETAETVEGISQPDSNSAQRSASQ
ncbi:MAG: CBS domain-containing protein [Acidobacteriota bacterium]